MQSLKRVVARLFEVLIGHERATTDERAAALSEERIWFAVQRAREAVDRKGGARASRRFVFSDDSDTEAVGGINRHEG
ncbi:hypothetical protein ACTHR6_24620 [Ralstonia holmesii]|uniref:hypothetical protein n=1 Tax=Ralstonia TaxID=48736 RepID=UPI000468CDE3|nr:hypothetical protein [Ralstonia pickettii]